MIPAEAVEAAAKKFAWALSDRKWEDCGRQEQDAYRGHAREALEAAAPHMRAPFVALAEEWAKDEQDAQHYVDHGYGEADGVREALGRGGGARRVMEILDGRNRE